MTPAERPTRHAASIALSLLLSLGLAACGSTPSARTPQRSVA